MNAFLHRSILCACVGIAITGAAAAAPAEEQAKAARFEKTLDGGATSW